jgi:hypothetical protein
MSEFIAFTCLLLILYFGVAKVIITLLPNLRNATAFLVALISAYLFSISLDNLWGPLIGGLSLTILPVVAGTAYGLAFYSIARRLLTKPNAARIAYFVIGALASLAGFVGHKHNLAVGVSLILLGLFLPFNLTAQSVPTSGD